MVFILYIVNMQQNNCQNFDKNENILKKLRQFKILPVSKRMIQILGSARSLGFHGCASMCSQICILLVVTYGYDGDLCTIWYLYQFSHSYFDNSSSLLFLFNELMLLFVISTGILPPKHSDDQSFQGWSQNASVCFVFCSEDWTIWGLLQHTSHIW